MIKSADALQTVSAKLKPLATAVSISDIDDPAHPLLSVNDAFCKMTGYAANDVVGQNCRFLQGRDTDPDSVTDLRTSVQKRQGIASCLLNYRKDGELFHNLVILSYYHSPSGRNICMGCQYELQLDRF
ncbi:MAG: PAS domain-containing protein, partial [Pseudomonadota bacterium]